MPELNNQNFNHLKIHTQYSICEGAVKIDDLALYCKNNKLKTSLLKLLALVFTFVSSDE